MAEDKPLEQPAQPAQPVQPRQLPEWTENADWKVFVCGPHGGSFGGSSTSFLVAEKGNKYNFFGMDAGAALDCIRTAAENGQLKKILDPDWFRAPNGQHAKHADVNTYTQNNKLTNGQYADAIGAFRQNQLNGFAITHAHTDHLGGLVISAPAEAVEKINNNAYPYKPIIGRQEVLNGVQKQFETRFSEGNKVYYQVPIEPGQAFLDIAANHYNKHFQQAAGHPTYIDNIFNSVNMHVKTYPLSHQPVREDPINRHYSTAFWVSNEKTGNAPLGSSFLFFGDTGFDYEERVLVNKELAMDRGRDQDKKLYQGNPQDRTAQDWHPLKNIWDDVARSVAIGHLKTIFIECAYNDGKMVAPHILFGHLSPTLLAMEINHLQEAVAQLVPANGPNSIPLDVVVTHIKPFYAGPPREPQGLNGPKKIGDNNRGDNMQEDTNNILRIRYELNKAWTETVWTDQYYVAKRDYERALNARRKSNNEDAEQAAAALAQAGTNKPVEVKNQNAFSTGVFQVTWHFPKQTDILYMKKGENLETDEAPQQQKDPGPGLFGGYRWRDIYNDYPALRGPRNYGSGGSSSYFMEEAAVLFGAMMIVVCTLCFCLGIGFGYGLPVLKRWRANKRNKRLN